ncbi:MAG: YlxM family DNA-binding protein [Fusobacteriaceae bacterium]
MELDEVLEVSVLLNYYKNLLTDKQRDYLVEHLEDDMSLSEIAKKHEVTRQAVYDNIKRGVKTLYEYEKKIGFYKKECEIEELLEKLKKNLTIENVDKILEELF